MRLSRVLRQQNAGNVSASMLSALSSIEKHGPLTLGALEECLTYGENAADGAVPEAGENILGRSALMNE